MAAGRDGPVAIGVSGGSDSLALLHLADRWAKQAGRSLVVLSLDHSLRQAAAQEVREVCARAAALGHRAIALKGVPVSPSQSDARELRHGLLAVTARAHGASLLLLGHTCTDMEETFLMRLKRGTGLASSAAPQPVSLSPVWPDGRGLQIGRPLMGQRRKDLQAWLGALGHDWVSDPTNVSDKYERVRTRKLIARLGQPDCLTRIVRDAALLRAVNDWQLSTDLRNCVRTDRHGQIEIMNPTPDAQVRSGLVGRLVQIASGGARPVDRQKLLVAIQALDSAPRGHRLTLGGAWLQNGAHGLLIGRDPGAVEAAWRGDIWDGRYQRTAQAAPASDPPFLVRHALPDTAGWREIVSERIEALADALGASAALTGVMFAPDYQTPRRSPAQT